MSYSWLNKRLLRLRFLTVLRVQIKKKRCCLPYENSIKLSLRLYKVASSRIWTTSLHLSIALNLYTSTPNWRYTNWSAPVLSNIIPYCQFKRLKNAPKDTFFLISETATMWQRHGVRTRRCHEWISLFFKIMESVPLLFVSLGRSSFTKWKYTIFFGNCEMMLRWIWPRFEGHVAE